MQKKINKSRWLQIVLSALSFGPSWVWRLFPGLINISPVILKEFLYEAGFQMLLIPSEDWLLILAFTSSSSLKNWARDAGPVFMDWVVNVGPLPVQWSLEVLYATWIPSLFPWWLWFQSGFHLAECNMVLIMSVFPLDCRYSSGQVSVYSLMTLAVRFP